MELSAAGLKRTKLVLESQVGKLLLPGDELIAEAKAGDIVVGPGLKFVEKAKGSDSDYDRIVVCKAGILAKKSLTKSNTATYFMEIRLRNYSTYKKDDIVAVVKSKKGDQYVLDIGTRDRVTLSKMGFEGATKKNRPDLKVGDCVYGKLVDLPSDFPLEITCVNSSGKSAGQGSLSLGFLMKVPVHLVRVVRDSSPKGNFMKRVGTVLPLEIVTGCNGYVWIKTKKLLTTVLVYQLLQVASCVSPDKYDQLIKSFRQSVSGWA